MVIGSGPSTMSGVRLSCICILLLGVLACTRDSVERAAVDQFRARRPTWDTIKAMSDEDTLFARIAYDFIDPIIKPAMPSERWERYRELFKRVQSSGGLERRHDRSVLIFERESGILGTGATYSYVYFPTAPPPEKVLTRLSDARPGSQFFRLLWGKWYLEQDRF